MRIVAAVAIGGALGAVGRYAVAGLAAAWLGGGFPLGTLAANVAGSFLMGALIEATALAWSPSPALRAMIAVGLLGGFTTFSAFSLDAVALLERGLPGQAALYVVASVALSLGGLFAGMMLLRRILA